MTTAEINQQLSQSWEQVFNGSAKAIDWVQGTRSGVPRLHSEADGLILELRRLRNTAKRLGRIAKTPMTVGFFGLSQAGKSYLISALAAGENGNLETIFDEKKLDFIDHINPPGTGKEATGLVTRFSRIANPGTELGFPLELRLFSEIEIAKILINSYFNDFDKEKIEYQCDQIKINQLFSQLNQAKTVTRSNAVSEDDVVDLQDYAMDNFAKSLSGLQGSYWSQATKLAPFLSIADRAKLFSVMWGEIAELNSIYIQFAQTLESIGNPASVYAPLSVVVKELDNGTLSQADSIMNVDILDRLCSERDSQIQIRPELADGSLASERPISLAQLAALTAELVFPLVNPTRVAAFNSVDLLDFPGYRGRLKLTSLADIKEGNPVSQLILRGKVAYLFERYTDSQEMNLLVVCTPSDKQSDVNDVGPVLERWIHKTQGETPELRQLRKPGLLWAITMFDRRMGLDLTKSRNMLEQSWGKGGMMQQTILERFGNYSWLSNWANNRAFNNVFLVRKPGFKVAFLNVKDERELNVVEQEQAQLALMRETFTNDADIQKHIADPGAAWDAMMVLNDGGMQRISDYLQQVALPQVKQQRIAEQLNASIHHMVENRFGSWYQTEGTEELAKKRELAQSMVSELSKRALLVGEFLRALELPKETIASLYFSDTDDSAFRAESNEPQQASFSSGFGLDGGGFNLFDNSAAPEPEVQKALPDKQSRFAHLVFRAWLDHLRQISMDQSTMRFFGFPATMVEGLIGELITAAHRLGLENKINHVVMMNERTGTRRDQLAERQVFSVNMQIVDFLSWLGMIDTPEIERPRSRVVADAGVFEFKPVPMRNNLPILETQAKPVMKTYLFDWFVALGQLCEQNAGHSAGREIDPVQNASLGEVLSVFKGAQV